MFLCILSSCLSDTLSGTCGKIELVLYVSMYVFIDNIFGLKTELINKKSEKTIGIRFFYTADELCNLQRYVQEYNGLKNRDDIVPFLFLNSCCSLQTFC